MDKIWYININGRMEGPFSIADLKRDQRITPDTLARKADRDRWVPMRAIPELKILFSDNKPSGNNDKKNKKPPKIISADNQLVLDMGLEPSYFFLLVILLLALSYSLFHFYINH